MSAATSSGGGAPSLVRRALFPIGLGVGGLWGLLMLSVLGVGIADRDVTVIVYAGSATLVTAWGVWLSVQLRRTRPGRAWLPVLVCTAASLLGPLAILLLAVRRVWMVVLHRAPRLEPPAVEREPVSSPPSRAEASSREPPAVELKPDPSPPLSPPGSSIYAPQRRVASPHSKPTLALVWRLGLAVLVFPATAVVVLFVLVLGGEKVITARTAHGVALFSGAVSSSAILVMTVAWLQAISVEESRRWAPGIGLIGAAVALVVGATVFFETGPQPPRDVVPPSVSGTPRVQFELTADPGRWNMATSSLTFAYEWWSCKGTCILRATSSRTYVVERADLGKRLQVSVSAARNAGGLRDWNTDFIFSRKTARVHG